MRTPWIASFLMLTLSACEGLPSLPSESGERVPTTAAFTGLTIAEGFEGAGEPVNNLQILAGTAVGQRQVVAQDRFRWRGVVRFGLKTERWRGCSSCARGGLPDQRRRRLQHHFEQRGRRAVQPRSPSPAWDLRSVAVVPDTSASWST